MFKRRKNKPTIFASSCRPLTSIAFRILNRDADCLLWLCWVWNLNEKSHFVYTFCAIVAINVIRKIIAKYKTTNDDDDNNATNKTIWTNSNERGAENMIITLYMLANQHLINSGPILIRAYNMDVYTNIYIIRTLVSLKFKQKLVNLIEMMLRLCVLVLDINRGRLNIRTSFTAIYSIIIIIVITVLCRETIHIGW